MITLNSCVIVGQKQEFWPNPIRLENPGVITICGQGITVDEAVIHYDGEGIDESFFRELITAIKSRLDEITPY